MKKVSIRGKGRTEEEKEEKFWKRKKIFVRRRREKIQKKSYNFPGEDLEE